MERIEEKKKKEMSEKRNIRDHKRRLLAFRHLLIRFLCLSPVLLCTIVFWDFFGEALEGVINSLQLQLRAQDHFLHEAGEGSTSAPVFNKGAHIQTKK